MEQISGLTPEERAKTDFMALGGKGTQSEQTMDILKNLAGKQEKETGREFTAEENRKNRAGAETLAKLKSKLAEGTPLSKEEKTKISDSLIGLDTTIAQYRGQLASASDKDGPHILAQIQDLWRQKTELEDKLNPKRGKGVESETYKNIMPGQFQVGKMFPVENKNTKTKKKTNIFGF
jgi:flagellar biosynthesis chaperone FliJ